MRAGEGATICLTPECGGNGIVFVCLPCHFPRYASCLISVLQGSNRKTVASSDGMGVKLPVTASKVTPSSIARARYVLDNKNTLIGCFV